MKRCPGTARILITALIFLSALGMLQSCKPAPHRTPSELKAELQLAELKATGEVREAILQLRRSYEDGGDAEAKGHAAGNLRRMGPRASGAILALIDTFTDETPLEKTTQRYVGGGIYTDHQTRRTSPAQEAQLAIESIGAAAVEPLICALLDERAGVRSRATRALRGIDLNWYSCHAATTSVPYFVAALEEGNSSVRGAAAAALVRIGDERAVGALIVALEDQDSGVRSEAARGLGEIWWSYHYNGTTEWWGYEYSGTAEPLIVCLGDEVAAVRKAAAAALGKIHCPKAVLPLVAALDDDNRDVRAVAEAALKEITGLELGSEPAPWIAWSEEQSPDPVTSTGRAPAQ